MPKIVAQDDVIIRTAQVILDPDTDPERYAAFADYYHVDIPDFDDWVGRLRASVPALFPAEFEMVANGDALLAALPGADGIICESLSIGETELAAAPQLKVVQNFGTDTRNIDLAACASRGVKVHTLRRRVNIAVAEHAFAMMLAMAKKLPLLNGRIDEASLHDAGFPARMHDRRHAAAANWGRVDGLGTLYGATVGCLGLGEIGREVASRAHAFGAEVLYHQRNRLPEDIELPLGARYCSFDDLLSRSDYISIHLPSNKSTEALIDADAFARMKDGAYLVNISRAAIIDRGALMDVLESDRLGGVALDVHYEEPSPADEPLKNYPKALLTPHSAVAGRDNAAADMEELIGNLAAAI
ncbi:MAG: 2-hydroxyacid dehydrogenase [Alphaproteobacteria bacterium]